MVVKDVIYEVSNNLGETGKGPPDDAPAWYFQHYPHGPAPKVLRDWINKAKRLVWVPDFVNVMWMTEDEDWDHPGEAS